MKLEKKDITALFILIVLCLLVRIVFYTGVFVNDDIQYIDHAWAMICGYNIWEQGGSQLAFRTGVVIPLAMSCAFFGFHEYVMTAYPILCSLGTCLCIFIAAFRIWGSRHAILSALIWIFFPLQICYDTSLSTAPQLSFFASAALLCLLEEKRFCNGGTAEKPSSKASVLFVLCGVILGMGWLVNAIFCLIACVALPVIFFMKIKWKHVALIFAGFLMVFSIELICCRVFSGSFLARIACISETESEIDSNRSLSYLPRVMFSVSNLNYVYHEGHFGIQWYLMIACTLYAFAVRERTAMALSAGVWLYTAYLQWGVISPDLTPITKYIRYFATVTPFMAIVLGWAFSRGSENRIPFLSRASKLNFVIYCIHCLLITTVIIEKNRAWIYDYRETYRIITSRNLPTPIYTDFRTRRYFEIYSSRKMDAQDLEIFHKSGKIPQKGTFVRFCSDVSRSQSYTETETPWWYLKPPPHWILYDTVVTRRNYERDINPQIIIMTGADKNSHRQGGPGGR